MILTVTLNPAVDKTCTLGALIPGDVNRLESSFSVAGGKGVNVTKVLRQFHLQTVATGFLGGYSGKMIEDALTKLGAECHFVKTKGDTRTNVNLLGENGYVTELLEPGPVISDKELESFRKEFDDCLECCDLVVLSGSAPKGVPDTIYADLIARCAAEGRKVFLDTSGILLREGILAKPYFIKPNLKELEFIAGKKLSERQEIVEEAKRLLKSGISKVVVSLGSRGLLYVDKEQVLFEEAKKVEAVNTVGCGDSVVASFCMSEAAGESPDIAIKKAVALAAANATTGESGLIPLNTYLDLL